jgi:hypothetical protein
VCWLVHSFVMAGFVPAIERSRRMDHRDKPGGDGLRNGVRRARTRGSPTMSPRTIVPHHRVVPAEAGISVVVLWDSETEVPAFAGMTPWVG